MVSKPKSLRERLRLAVRTSTGVHHEALDFWSVLNAYDQDSLRPSVCCGSPRKRNRRNALALMARSVVRCKLPTQLISNTTLVGQNLLHNAADVEPSPCATADRSVSCFPTPKPPAFRLRKFVAVCTAHSLTKPLHVVSAELSRFCTASSCLAEQFLDIASAPWPACC